MKKRLLVLGLFCLIAIPFLVMALAVVGTSHATTAMDVASGSLVIYVDEGASALGVQSAEVVQGKKSIFVTDLMVPLNVTMVSTDYEATAIGLFSDNLSYKQGGQAYAAEFVAYSMTTARPPLVAAA